MLEVLTAVNRYFYRDVNYNRFIQIEYPLQLGAEASSSQVIGIVQKLFKIIEELS